MRVKHGVARDRQSGRDFALLGIQVELDDRHRGNGPEIVRVDDAQQGVADLREIVLELQVDACGQEGKPFEEALHVRVLALRRLEQEA